MQKYSAPSSFRSPKPAFVALCDETETNQYVNDRRNTMADQQLRDNKNRLIGTIKTRSDGKLEIRDEKNSLKGSYDPKSNNTRDHTNRLVGKGNLLATLI